MATVTKTGKLRSGFCVIVIRLAKRYVWRRPWAIKYSFVSTQYRAHNMKTCVRFTVEAIWSYHKNIVVQHSVFVHSQQWHVVNKTQRMHCSVCTAAMVTRTWHNVHCLACCYYKCLKVSVLYCCFRMTFLMFYGEKFSGAFAKFRKATISFVMSVSPSFRMEQLGSHWVNFYEIL